MEDSNEDRRTHPRLPVSLPVEYTSLSDFFVDYVVDISHGGMFIATERKIDPGTQVDIQFSLPETEAKFTAKGTVVRHGPLPAPGSDMPEDTPQLGIGIKFDPLPPESREIVEKLWQSKIKE